MSEASETLTLSFFKSKDSIGLVLKALKRSALHVGQVQEVKVAGEWEQHIAGNARDAESASIVRSVVTSARLALIALIRAGNVIYVPLARNAFSVELLQLITQRL